MRQDRYAASQGLSTKGIAPESLSAKTLMTIYNSAVIPKALYGCELWNYISAGDLSKLQRSHMVCIKSSQGLRMSTSTELSLVTVDSVPVETIIDCNKLKFFGQLCRLNPYFLVKDIFHNRLIRFHNCDKEE